RLRVGGARPTRAAPRRDLARGLRLDERNVRERRQGQPAAQARPRRHRPGRRDRLPVRAMNAVVQQAAVTDAGRKRRRNEDAYICSPPLFAIADGMGGAQAGELASKEAVEALRVGADNEDSTPQRRVVALIQDANRRVYDRAAEDEAASGMGTTMTVALVVPGEVWIGHVGDSRAYRIRDGSLEQLTEDHSLVAELVRSGKLSPEEAEVHPQRSVITRALGTDPDVDVDTFEVEAEPGDLFLLCSDG